MRLPPFDTYGIDDEQVLCLKETCEMLSEKYRTQVVNLHQRKDLVNAYLKGFEGNIAGVLLIDNQFKQCLLVILKVMFQGSRLFMPNPELRHNTLRVVALARLKRNFGTVFIRRKTLTDRLLNPFLPVALNFKGFKSFNRQFYVTSDDPERALQVIDARVIELLMNLCKQDFAVNITGRQLVVEGLIMLDPAQTLKLAEFASCMAAV
ncbi:hypothetical protein HH214_09365 [Mucilaginibacter robiniae]|uniref:Uncharacterized protein n=1 Tax=Mucilaginibacter robiniae TaxID=2728022 RepID=A0A7L5E0P2_9SPHI|nr:hypothetical protein [Mucilaginibacter robiniae]QJD96068.1 hypothetical protein HH214_09365 [Mucilaginibacter robiniae]